MAPDAPDRLADGGPHAGTPTPRAKTVPGQKRARHQRWTKAVTWLTIAGLVAFAGFAAWGIRALFSKPSPEETARENCRSLFRGLSSAIEGFRGVRGRLPTTLAELRAPDLPTDFEAQPRDPWDRPVEYVITDEAKGEFRLRSLGPDGKRDTPDDVAWPSAR